MIRSVHVISRSIAWRRRSLPCNPRNLLLTSQNSPQRLLDYSPKRCFSSEKFSGETEAADAKSIRDGAERAAAAAGLGLGDQAGSSTSPQQLTVPNIKRNMKRYLRQRDHDGAMNLFRGNETLFSYEETKSLLGVCYSHAHLSVAQELIQKFGQNYGRSSTSVPEQAFLSLSRCYTASDTPQELRKEHIEQALEVITQLKSCVGVVL